MCSKGYRRSMTAGTTGRISGRIKGGSVGGDGGSKVEFELCTKGKKRFYRRLL